MGTIMLYILWLSSLIIVIIYLILQKKSRFKQRSLCDFREEALVDSILNKIESMVVVWKDDLSFLNISRYMENQLGLEGMGDEQIFQVVFEINEINKRKRADEILGITKSKGQIAEYYFKEKRYIMWHSILWYTNEDNVRTIFSIGYDVTEKIKLSKRLRICAQTSKIDKKIIHKLVFEDEITGLYNKRKFIEEGNKLLQDEKQTIQYVLMCININQFSFISNIYGQKAAKEILKNVAQVIKENTSQKGIYCKRGEGGFAVLFQEQDEEAIRTFYESLRASISEIRITDNINYKLDILAGVAIYPRDGIEMNVLYENAEFVINDMKKAANATLQMFDSRLKESIIHQQVMAIQLKQAIENKELTLYYQPKINCLTKQIVGMEALIRWLHPQKGFVPPDKFIPIAEQSGLIIEIGKWGLMQACLQNKDWHLKGYEKHIISVNMSAIEFYQDDMIDNLKNILEISGLEPKYLEIELTESMAIMDEKKTIKILSAIKALGVKIALDDFGTGYSSLSYLKILPIDVLKLDRSFVFDIDKDYISQNIVFTIINLAKTLNIETVAEGVETKAQAEILKQMGCTMIQGYYYSKPLPSNVFEKKYIK